MLCDILEKLGRLYTSWHAFYALMILDGCTVIKGEFFITCCIGRVLHLRRSIHFFALMYAFLCSMLSEGVLVLRWSVWAFCALLLSCICIGGACEFYAPVSVVLSRCSCLWGSRLFQVDLAFVIPLMQVTLLLTFMRYLFTWIWVLLAIQSLGWDFQFLPLKPFLLL